MTIEVAIHCARSWDGQADQRSIGSFPIRNMPVWVDLSASSSGSMLLNPSERRSNSISAGLPVNPNAMGWR